MKRHSVTIHAEQPPVVELDSAAHAAYVRFSHETIARTEPVTTEGCIVTMDFDAAGEVVGIELVGVHEFGICRLLEKAHVKPLPKHLAERTRYVPADLQLV